MISRVRLKFGPRQGGAPLGFDPGAMTVFVGPNNSGKSLILRELELVITNMGSVAPTKIVQDVVLAQQSQDRAIELFLSRQDPSASTPQEETIFVARLNLPGSPANAVRYRIRLTETAARVAKGDIGALKQLASLFTARLDGRTRLGLTDPVSGGDLLARPSNHLMALFRNDVTRNRLRSITFDAFRLYFVIDPTNMTQLRVRLSARPPSKPQEERGWDDLACAFHAQAQLISEFSDGVKAYTGLIAALLSSDFRVILVDEPDAFLHPPLARRLGRTLVDLAGERDANVFASTHSSEFVMGAISSGAPINIVRLTYSHGTATGTLLAASELRHLMRDALLRSTGVMNALFHNSAIICEGDRDRAFYQEINDRLLAVGADGADGCLFLHAHNKQSEGRLIRPLREMGIPTAAIVDIDIIKGDDLKHLLHACFVPDTLVGSLGVLRGDIFRVFKDQKLDMHDGGISLLDAKTKESAGSLIDQVAEYGVFIVPNGDVESWLPDVAQGVRKDEWLAKIFERMGSDPAEPGYLHPAKSGVWEFIKKVAAWVENPNRRGMGT